MTRTARGAALAAGALALCLATACSSGGGPSALPGTATAHIGALRITGGYIPQPASPDVAAAYFTVLNTGSTPDTLLKARSNVTSAVVPMGETESGGTGSMTDLPKVVIPAHGMFRFTPGHAHLMLERPTRPLRRGERIRMTLTFAKAGTVSLVLPVVPLTGPVGGTATTMPGMSSSASD